MYKNTLYFYWNKTLFVYFERNRHTISTIMKFARVL